jgi:sterol desaturase/sphingolipid hydroxylase (fatty acid hydroxylase superfamily)
MEMYPDIIAIGIPPMILCLVIEFFYDRKQEKKNYRWNGTISNVSCGIFEQVTGFLSKGLFLYLYFVIYEKFRIVTLADTLLVWIALIVLVDLIFYFFHRYSHRSSLLWSGHMVHHEVEEFNLSVALRRSVMQEFTIIGAYLPLAILGFSPGAFFLVFAAHNLYQFLIHTSYLPEFKIFGLIFNTPHHHEIHHCRNQCYVDKNFAGVFIIWDKLFGTFAEPSEKYEFGIGQQTITLNPVKAQVTTLMMVIREAKQRKGLKNKLNALFGPPSYLSVESINARNRQNSENKAALLKRYKYDPQVSQTNKRKIISFFAVLLIIITAYRNFEASLPLAIQVTALIVIASALYYVGVLLDNKKQKEKTMEKGTGDACELQTDG